MSEAGHDKGMLYVVVGRERDFLLLCDGKRKLLSNPKRKNVRHLTDTGERAELSIYNPLYDAHIRKELKRLSKCVNTNGLPIK